MLRGPDETTPVCWASPTAITLVLLGMTILASGFAVTLLADVRGTLADAVEATDAPLRDETPTGSGVSRAPGSFSSPDTGHLSP